MNNLYIFLILIDLKYHINFTNKLVFHKIFEIKKYISLYFIVEFP